MGWIRDRMEDLEPPVQSLIELAQRVRKAKAWPRAERIKESSLATYLGKFDAGEALEWLEQRPGALQALAEILEMSQEEAEEQLAQLQPPRSSTGSRVRLRDVPVRPMDLRRESLPPGIPVQVRDPATWPLWWQAPSGAGRTLTGQWLEARGQALFLQAETWAEAERQLPEQGAVYLVLGSGEGAPLQATWPSGLKLCVATESPAPRPSEREVERGAREPRELPLASASRRPAHSVWLPVSSPEARSVLRELVDWVAERLTVEGFDREACQRWLLETPGLLARVDTLGTALGFIGLFAIYGKKGDASGLAKARTAADLARLFLRLRLQQSESVDLPLEQLWKRLQHLGQRLLLESDTPSAELRSTDGWLSLMHVRPDGADLAWLQELERQGLKVDRTGLQKLQGRLPAETFRVVRGLKELGLLRERQPSLLGFQPPWVLAALIEQALLETLEQGPLAWGTVLLRREHAPAVFEALLERCRGGDFSQAWAVLQAPDTRSPAWVAALEAIFRVLGLALLEGKAVPEPLRLGVLRLQRALVVPDDVGLPLPRIAYELPSARESLLVDHRVWDAALLALSETLTPEAGLSLESWCTKPSEEARRGLLYRASYRPPQEPRMPEVWLLPLLLLGGRLLDTLGPPAAASTAIPLLLQPEHQLRFLQQPQVSLSHLNPAVFWRALGPLMPEYTRRRGGDWALCVRKIWAAWLSSNPTELPSFLHLEEAHAEIFWRYLPPQAVEVLASLRHRHLLGEKDACRFFQAEHWAAFMRVWLEKTEPWGTAPMHALWQRIPAEYVRQAIRAGRPDKHDHATRKELWQRLPEVFCEELDALFRQGQWDKALTQVCGAPPSAIPRLLASAKAALEHRSAAPPASVIQWLHQTIAQRAPDWSKAWTLLEYLMPPAPV